MFNRNFIKKFLVLPEVAKIPIDSDERVAKAGEIIKKRPFLRKIYDSFYKEFVRCDNELKSLNGISLELGSGAGYLKDLLPSVITSDVVKYENVDRVENAYSFSFENSSLRAVYMLDVLHHLGDVKRFFGEVDRCLKPGGRLVLIEPYSSYWSRFFYKNFHHEPHDNTVVNWEFPDKGPLSSANSALPTIIFHRDRKIFEKLYPNLKIREIKYHTFLLYILSGGLSRRQLSPSFLYTFFALIEKILNPFMKKYLAWFQTIVIEKR